MKDSTFVFTVVGIIMVSVFSIGLIYITTQLGLTDVDVLLYIMITTIVVLTPLTVIVINRKPQDVKA